MALVMSNSQLASFSLSIPAPTKSLPTPVFTTKKLEK